MKSARIMLCAGVVVCLLVAATFVTGCSDGESTSQSSSNAEPYKIGAILSLTGTYAALGQSEKQALELEEKRINDGGGINGRPIEIIIVDDATEEAKAVAAASQLIEQDNVLAILGATGTGQSMAIRGDVQRADIADVSMAGGTVITADFDEHVFQTPWSNTIVVPFVLNKIKSDGHTKVALISDSSGYGKDGRDIVLADSKGLGLEIVADETFNPGDTDMTAQLTRIKSSGADAVLLWTAGKEGAMIVKGARDLGITSPLYGGSGQARSEFVKAAGDAADGFVFGTGKSLVPANWGEGSGEFDVVNGFAERYNAEYGADPDIFAGHAFDAISIAAAALDNGPDDPTRADLRDSIEKISDLVGFGGAFTFSPDNHNGLTEDDLSLYQIENGAWTPIQQ